MVSTPQVYEWVEPGTWCGNPATYVYRVSEDYIIATQWEYWKGRMEKIYGKDHELITKEHCVEDFCSIHYAHKLRG